MGGQINIGDTWKNISGMQINIGDTWKVVTSAQINIGDTWKTWYTSAPSELSGLIHCLDVGNTSSYPGTGSTWYDLSTNAKNATISGAVYNSTNNALYFNGSSDYASCTLVTGKTGGITMEMVFKPTNIANAGQVIYYNGLDNSSNGYGAAINTEGTTDGKYRGLYGGVAWFTSTVASANDTWTHYVFMINDDRSNKMFVNGSQIYTGTTATINAPTSTTYIGKNNYGASTGRCFEGYIASVRQYNRTLTDAEVLQIYNAHKR